MNIPNHLINLAANKDGRKEALKNIVMDGINLSKIANKWKNKKKWKQINFILYTMMNAEDIMPIANSK